MPAVKTDAVKRTISEFERGSGGRLHHYICSGGLRAEFTLIVRPCEN